MISRSVGRTSSRLRRAVSGLESAVSRLERRRRPRHDPASSTRPDVSVVLTTRDRPSLVRLAIESVVLQTEVDLECVVVDDGSHEEHLSALIELARHHRRRVRLFRHELSLGLASARNTGIMNAAAPVVCFLDDDDYLCHRSLAARLSELRRRPGLAGVYCDWRTVGPDDELDHFRPLRRPRRLPDATLESLPFGTPFIATAPMLHRDVLVGAGGFNEALDRVEDAELWMRLFRSGHRFGYARHIGVVYRQSPTTMVGGAPRNQLFQLMEVAEWLDRTIPLDQLAPGPCPEPSSLSRVKRVSEQLPQLLQYLALVAAVQELDEAVDVGLGTIPATLRRHEILETHASRGVRALVMRAGVSSGEARSIVENLIKRLDVGPPAQPSHPDATVRALHRPLGVHPGRICPERATSAFHGELGEDVRVIELG